MMTLGYKSFITEEQLWKLPRADQADALSNTFQTNWQKQLDKKGKPSLWIAIGRSFGGPFAVAFGLKMVQDALQFVQPQLLRRLLAFVESYDTDEPEPAMHGYVVRSLFVL